MDEGWATAELKRFVNLTRLVQPRPSGDVVLMGDFRRPVGDVADIVASAQVVEQILARVIPNWRQLAQQSTKHEWEQHREAALRAVSEIENRAVIAAKLGDNAPSINAAALHLWVWDAARSLWSSGHYREAVTAVAVKINAEAQNKLGRRDISETDLFKQAFSADGPKPDSPRLRLPADDGGKTALSQRRGVAAFAEGCFAAIRNPASHDDLGDLPAQEALEQMAAFSVLARWVDGAVRVDNRDAGSV